MRMASTVELVYLPFGDLLVEAGIYRWMVSSEKLCDFSRFFAVACVPGRFMEGQERRIEIKEAKPWMVARVIQWAYTGTFDRVCCDRVRPRLFRPDFQQLIGNAAHTVEYFHDIDECALMSTYDVSAEVYELAQRFMMPDLCAFIAREMLERYRQQAYGSWPPVVFNTLKKASEEIDEIRTSLSTLLAAQIFFDRSACNIGPRLRNIIEEDSHFACELVLQMQLLANEYQTAMDSMLPRTWQARSEMTAMKMKLAGQDLALTNLRALQAVLVKLEIEHPGFNDVRKSERYFSSSYGGA